MVSQKPHELCLEGGGLESVFIPFNDLISKPAYQGCPLVHWVGGGGLT